MRSRRAEMARSGEQTKEQLVRQLGSRTKDELVAALESHLTKDDLVSLLESRLKKDELASVLEREREEPRREEEEERKPRPDREDAGEAPSIQGRRVRVDVSGLPMLGIFLGPGASAAGTITGVDAERREL